MLFFFRSLSEPIEDSSLSLWRPPTTHTQVTTVNIVSDRDNFVWKGHDKLAVRGGPQSLKAGFQASSIFQLHPPAAATSLTLHAAWSLLAVGTAHGMALYDTVRHQ